jgi:hypothetical protein
MQAELIYENHQPLSENEIAHMLVWRVPFPVHGSGHAFKYRLAFVVDGECVLRYDNETGKGDHKHVGGREEKILFESPARLLADFLAEVEKWRKT